MVFARFSLLFLFVGLAPFATAGGKPNPPDDSAAAPLTAKAGSVDTINIAQPVTMPDEVSEQPMSRMFRTVPVIATRNTDVRDHAPGPQRKAQSGHNLADLNGNVCFTMRTYKVKPEERVPENESTSRGYSECEMASDYQIQSAVAHDHGPARVK